MDLNPDPVVPEPSLARVRARIVRWPDQAAAREAAHLDGVPCLLVVARGTVPPITAGAEDWIWVDADERDIACRLADLGRLTGVAAPTPTDWLGPIAVPDGVGPLDVRVATVLLRRAGRLVPRRDLADPDSPGAGAGDTPAGRELDRCLRRLRGPLGRAGWVLRTIGGGVLVERAVAA